MSNTNLNSRWMLLLLLASACAGGCCQAFPVPGEGRCPTDARRIYVGAGEEAVRRCPCGPDRAFYGHKPTDWRTWPEGWRYGQYPCCPREGQEMTIEPQEQLPPGIPAEVPNPFRNDSHSEAPPPAARKPPEVDSEISFGPAKPAPLPTLPPQSSPIQPAPAANTPSQGKQDLRSAADIINDSAPGAVPTSNEPPTPGDELNPPIPTGLEPAEDKTNQGADSFDLSPRLVTAQSAAATENAKKASETPASSWRKAPAANATGNEAQPPVSKRVADHLSHNLFN